MRTSKYEGVFFGLLDNVVYVAGKSVTYIESKAAAYNLKHRISLTLQLR